MGAHFFDLPAEILVKVLCYLEPYSLASCGLTHSSLYTCINQHQIIQYHVAKHVAAVEDNPYCTPSVSISDRLASLRSREKGWASLNIDFRCKMPVKHEPSGIYDVGGGVYLMGDRDRKTLHYLELPKTEREARQLHWKKIEVEKRLIDMALAIYEHDLIAVVTSTPSTSNYGLHLIELHLLQFSTGKPHPLAKNHVVRVYESQWPFPSIGMEIVGENLALILTHYMIRNQPDDSFYIIDWKEGTLKMGLSIAFHTYCGLVFLSPHVLLLPNMRRGTLDLWIVPDSQDSAMTRPIRSLGLPALGDLHFIVNLSCRGEPNPVGADSDGGGLKHSKEPFHPKSEDAIVIFNMRVQKAFGNMASYTFSMFAHRKALLGLCPDKPDLPPTTEMAAVEEEDGEDVLLDGEGFDEVDEDESGDEGSEDEVVEGEGSGDEEMDDGGSEDGMDAESTPSAFTSAPAGDAPTLVPTASASASVSASTTANPPRTSTPNPNAFPAPLSWSAWGPPLTRWFDTDDIPMRWITTSAGQRCVIYSEGSEVGDVKPSLTLFDFNAGNWAGIRPDSDRSSGGGEDEEVRLRTGIQSCPTEISGEMFQAPVQSCLPFKSFGLGDFGVFDGVLMDDERLLGLKASDEDGRIVEVEVMHIGKGPEE